MKRYLLALVNAITELTELVRFVGQDLNDNIEDLATQVYIGNTSSPVDVSDSYDEGWTDGWNEAFLHMEAEASLPTIPTLDELNQELQDTYWDDPVDNAFPEDDFEEDLFTEAGYTEDELAELQGLFGGKVIGYVF